MKNHLAAFFVTATLFLAQPIFGYIPPSPAQCSNINVPCDLSMAGYETCEIWTLHVDTNFRRRFCGDYLRDTLRDNPTYFLPGSYVLKHFVDFGPSDVATRYSIEYRIVSIDQKNKVLNVTTEL